MNTLTRFPLTCLAACYHAAYRLHHRLCLKPGQPLQNSSLYVIGSFRIGGAGKSPFTAWFVRFLREQGAGRIAVLCHAKARDEAQMLRQRLAQLPQVQVFSTGNRYRTAHELDGEFDAIVCDDGFEDSRTYKWFLNNSYKYGFIIRYPKGKSDYTGVGFRPRILRYVGRYVATKMHDEGLCLEEFIEKYNLERVLLIQKEG